MIQNAIQKLVSRVDLTEQEVMDTMGFIMDGNATPAQIGSFMTALRIKGETIEEITGCAKAMRQKAHRIHPNVDYCIDTCGTGGDGANTFNISTAAAFITAAGGVPVAKHGNRSVSSKSGSADVLEALGVNLELMPEEVSQSIETIGIGFLFAPVFHKSMKYAGAPRKEIGIRTIFNILGPLTNPADVRAQVLGVFDGDLVEPLGNVLLNLGMERALVIHGDDGLDEITLTGATKVCEVKDGRTTVYAIRPEEYGLTSVEKNELTGGDAAVNAGIIREIFSGKKGPQRDVVVLNAAAALYVGKKADSIADGVKLAEEIIDSGKAAEKLEQLISFTLRSKECCRIM